MHAPPAPRLTLQPAPPQSGQGLQVALSGGLDSSVLLHALAHDPAHREGLRALHVHHGLHACADAWAVACESACARLGIGLTVIRVAVDPHGGDGPEAAARRARMAAFADALAGGGVLALAHHRRDQAETFLLRALRGSGVDGLSAMAPLRGLGAGWLWRPLLAVPREALEAYASAHALAWVDDPSNDDDTLDRNFLRLRVLPGLRSRWPGVDAALARSAALAAEASALLDTDDDAIVAAALGADGALAIAPLRVLAPPRAARVLRRWVSRSGLPPLPAAGVRKVLEDLVPPAASPGIATFAWSGVAISRWRGALHLRRVAPSLDAGYREHWTGWHPLRLPGGDCLRLASLPVIKADGDVQALPCAPRSTDERPGGGPVPPALGPFVVHARHGGERIRLPGRPHGHMLKHVLQDAGIPPWARQRMPLLSSPDGELLAAGDRILADGFEARLRAHGLQLRWEQAGGPRSSARLPAAPRAIHGSPQRLP